MSITQSPCHFKIYSVLDDFPVKVLNSFVNFCDWSCVLVVSKFRGFSKQKSEIAEAVIARVVQYFLAGNVFS